MTPPDAAAFIRAHLPVLPVPGLPEIHLHKAVPASGVGRLAGDEAPYWAHYWAGGVALARYILDHPERVAGRRVPDLCAGSGLVEIAAMKAGARDGIAIYADPHAPAAVELNARPEQHTADLQSLMRSS